MMKHLVLTLASAISLLTVVRSAAADFAFNLTTHQAQLLFGTSGFNDPAATVTGASGNPAVFSAQTTFSGGTYSSATSYKINWLGNTDGAFFPAGSTVDFHYDFTITLTPNTGGTVNWTVFSTGDGNTPFLQTTGQTSNSVTHVLGDLTETLAVPGTSGGLNTSLTFSWTSESPTATFTLNAPSTNTLTVSTPEPGSLLLLAFSVPILTSRRNRRRD